jgi:hypothetical protein
MRAVVTLVVSYFTRTPGLRWFSLGATLGNIAAAAVLLMFRGAQHTETVDALTSLTVFLSGCSLFLGAGLMPHMVGRLASSHAFCVLPRGRLRLFLSALFTATIVTVPLPSLFVLSQVSQTPPQIMAHYTLWEQAQILWAVFGEAYPTTFLAVTWLYLAIYFVTTERTLVGLTKALLIIIALIYVPTQRIVELDPMLPWTWFEVTLTWAFIAAWLFLVPRFKSARARRASWFAGSPRSGRYAPGREFELLLGTAQPWLLAVAMLFPVAIQTLIGFRLPETWLFYLTLFSVVAGGLAGRAAERSRAVWLRAHWSRAQLFTHVEAAFWKHNSLALAALLALLIVAARTYDLPARVIPLGVPLLVIAMIVSMYLGLMMTRGLRWLESSIAIVVMLAVMGVAVMAAREVHDAVTVASLEVLLAVLAIALRFVARARWHHIDWTLCRPERGEAARVTT